MAIKIMDTEQTHAMQYGCYDRLNERLNTQTNEAMANTMQNRGTSCSTVVMIGG